MNRQDFEKAVWDSDLNPYARLVLLTFVGRAHYKEVEPEVFPSQAWVSQATGIGKNTVGRYVEALVKEGWLVPASMHGRAQGYTLAQGNVPMTGTLAKVHRGNQFTGNVPMIGTLEESNVPMEHEERPHGATTNVPMEQPYRPHDGDLITKNNHIEQPKKNHREDSQAHPPFDKDREVLPMNNLETSLPLSETGPGTGLNKEEQSYYFYLTDKKRWTHERAMEQIEYNREDW